MAHNLRNVIPTDTSTQTNTSAAVECQVQILRAIRYARAPRELGPPRLSAPPVRMRSPVLTEAPLGHQSAAIPCGASGLRQAAADGADLSSILHTLFPQTMLPSRRPASSIPCVCCTGSCKEDVLFVPPARRVVLPAAVLIACTETWAMAPASSFIIQCVLGN